MHVEIPGASEAVVNTAMEQISSALRAVGVKQISLSPNNVYWSRKFYCQDWVLWLKKGWIDDVMVQLYFPEPHDFDYNVKKTLSDVPRQFHQHVGFGLGVVIEKALVPIGTVTSWLSRLQQEPYLKGVAFWHAGTILKEAYKQEIVAIFGNEQSKAQPGNG